MRHPNRIAYYRDRCDPPLTQTELARLLGVHPNTVQNWERDGVARASALLRLVRVFAERGALACYHDGLAFWRAAARGAVPPPPELLTLFVAAEAPAVAGALPLPLAEIPPPTWAGRLPYGPNPRFVGREGDLRVLAALLRPAGAVVAICGLGGLGKTQLALEFALRYGAHFAGGVCWIDATDPAAIAAQVAEQGGPELHPRFERLSLARRAELVRAAWARVTPRLLIFDNCEHPAAFFEWRPVGGGCRALATSRTRDWARYEAAQVFEPEPIERRASLALLRSYREGGGADAAALAGLAAALGDLPLALHLAGRYLAASGAEPAAYLAEIRQARGLRHRSFTGGGPSPTDYRQTLAETVARSYARLGHDPVDREARALLEVARLLAPGAPIPVGLLFEALGERAGPGRGESALARLCEGIGLVSRSPDGRQIRVHPVVHAFLRELPAPPERRRSLARAAVAQADAAGVAGAPLDRALLAQLRHLAERAAERGDPEAGDLRAALARATGEACALDSYYAESDLFA